jgi:hypothetical protein
LIEFELEFIILSIATMAPASENALSSDFILDYMSKSLSPESDQSPLLKDPYSAIALFSHACMLAVGFRLIGLGEDHKIGMSEWIVLRSTH